MKVLRVARAIVRRNLRAAGHPHTLAARAAASFSTAAPPQLTPAEQEVAALQRSLATALSEGRLDTALDLAERCRASIGDLVGQSSAPYASALNNLALVRKQRGELDAAVPLLEQSLALYRSAVGNSHPSVAAALSNLGLLHVRLAQRLQGRSGGDALGVAEHAEIAQKYLEQAMDLRKAASAGGDDPAVATAAYQLASPLRLLRRYHDAEVLLTYAVNVLRRVPGPTSPLTATALNNLGFLLKETREYARAEEAYAEAAAIRTASLGPAHQDTIAALHNLAEARRAAGDEDGAREVQARIVAALEAAGVRREDCE